MMMTFIAGHLHKISCLITHQFTEKVGNRNKPAPHIEVPFPKGSFGRRAMRS